MLDRKINHQARNRKPRKLSPVKSLPVNEMVYKTSWIHASVASGTTGQMASWTSPSIIHSSEYSQIGALFTEVKLIRATFIFTPLQAVNGSVLQTALVVSTNFLRTENTSGNDPASYTDVQNQTHSVRLSTLSVIPLRYRMPIPKGLEFANLASDSPNPPIPWAGCPGIVSWFAGTATPSTNYFALHVEAIYHLRGRQ